MTLERVERSITTTAPAPVVADATVQPAPAGATVRTQSSRITTTGPSRPELGRRITTLVFGLIQLVITARIVLLLFDAREANGLVSGILNFSQLFVAPFEGILRTDALRSSGSILDVTAIVALVGWTILELVIVWAVGMFRRERV
jgi:hypothetical protein